MAEKGIFINPDEFKSDLQIKRDALLNEGQQLIIESHPLIPKNVFDYLESADERKPDLPSSEKVEAFLPDTTTVALMGDLHFGHPNTDNERITREVSLIAMVPDVAVVLLGDLTDGIFWGGESQAEQSQSIDEQQGFLRALFTELKGKVIAGVGGEHDSKWPAKTGADPYSQFQEITGAPYIRGVAEISLDVGDEQTYEIVASHGAKGHSIYNKVHGLQRQAKFDLQGADIYVAGHTHRKQIAQEGIRDINGSHTVTHVNIGPYKSGDGYGERLRYVSQNPDEMYGAAIRLHAEEKKVDVEYDILEAIKQWNK